MAKAEVLGACSYFFRAALARARQWIFAVAHKIDDPAHRRSYLENVPENRRTLELARRWLGEGD